MAEMVLATTPTAALQGRRVLVVMPIPAWPALETQIRAWLLPLLLLRQAGCRIVLVPELPGEATPGRVNHAVADALRAAGVERVQVVPGLDGPALAAVTAAGPGMTLVLENLWAYESGRQLTPPLARQLAALADLAVGDAPRWRTWLQGYLPVLSVRPPAPWGWPQPAVAVLGGGDVVGKVPLLIRLSLLVDRLALAGAVAVNVKLALGESLGCSLAVPGVHGVLRAWWAAVGASGLEVVLPEDYWLVDPEAPADAVTALYDPVSRGQRAALPVLDVVPPELAVGDLGPQSLVRVLGAVRSAASILWSGPLGITELGQTAATRELVATIGRRRRQGAVTVAAGDTTLDLVQAWSAGGAFSYLLATSQDLLVPPEVLRQAA